MKKTLITGLLLVASVCFAQNTRFGGSGGSGTTIDSLGAIANVDVTGKSTGEVIKVQADGSWAIGTDNTGAGASVTVDESGVTQSTGVDTIDFETGFDVATSGNRADITLDRTEVNSHTWGDNSTTPITVTYDPTGATNPTLAIANDQFTFTGNVVIAVGGLALDNNESITFEDAGATARDGLRLNSSDIWQVGSTALAGTWQFDSSGDIQFIFNGDAGTDGTIDWDVSFDRFVFSNELTTPEVSSDSLHNLTNPTITNIGVTDTLDVQAQLQALSAEITGTLNAGTITEGGLDVPNSTDVLSFFSATTSVQLANVLSDETGTPGTFMLSNSPTITSPFIAIVNGGSGAGGDISIRGTSNVTPGDVQLSDLGGDVIVGGGATASEFRLLEPSGSGTNYSGFISPALAANTLYTMPNADGTNGQALTTDGSLGLSWSTVAAGGGGGSSAYGSMGFQDSTVTITATGGGTFDVVSNATNNLFTTGVTSNATIDGDSILVSEAGDYFVYFSLSYSAGNASDYEVQILVDGSPVGNKAHTFRGMSGSDFGVAGSATLHNLGTDNRVELGIAEAAGTTDPVFTSGELGLFSMPGGVPQWTDFGLHINPTEDGDAIHLRDAAGNDSTVIDVNSGGDLDLSTTGGDFDFSDDNITTTGDVGIGTTAGTAALIVANNEDETGVLIQGNATQNNPLLVVENNATTDAFVVNGNLTIELEQVTASRLLALDASNLIVATITEANMEASVSDDNPVFDGDFGANGLMTRTAAGTYTNRTITGGTGILVADGDGVSGNPTITNDFDTAMVEISFSSCDTGLTATSVTFAKSGKSASWVFAASTRDTLHCGSIDLPDFFAAWVGWTFTGTSEATGADSLVVLTSPIAHDEPDDDDDLTYTNRDTLVAPTGPAAGDHRESTELTSFNGTAHAAGDKVWFGVERLPGDAGVFDANGGLKLFYRRTE